MRHTTRSRQGPLRWTCSVLNNPIVVSTNALSSASPTLLSEGSIPASSSRLVNNRVCIGQAQGVQATPACAGEVAGVGKPRPVCANRVSCEAWR